MPGRRGVEWRTIGQQQHVVLSWSRFEGRAYGSTACGWLVSPSAHDTAPDAPVCAVCEALHPDAAPQPAAWAAQQ